MIISDHICEKNSREKLYLMPNSTKYLNTDQYQMLAKEQMNYKYIHILHKYFKKVFKND